MLKSRIGKSIKSNNMKYCLEVKDIYKKQFEEIKKDKICYTSSLDEYTSSLDGYTLSLDEYHLLTEGLSI